jgi:Uri superfamily endonuclease
LTHLGMSRPPAWLRVGGTYALIVWLDEAQEISIGRLGSFAFPRGSYVYVGSALGPGGLASRLSRHLRKGKRLRWHVDYLLERAEVASVHIQCSKERLECRWARQLLAAAPKGVIVPRFGSSDCDCPAHLLWLGPGRRTLKGVVPDALAVDLAPANGRSSRRGQA